MSLSELKYAIALLIPVLVLSIFSVAQEPAFQITHKGSILRLKFSPSASMLVSYSSGNQDIAVWDVRSGRLLWKRPISFIQKADEYYTLNSIAWSPNEKLIATGSGNGTVQLWDAATGKLIWLADAHPRDVTAVAFSSDGQLIASTSNSGESDSLKLIRATDGKVIRTFQGDPCTGVAILIDHSSRKLKVANLDGNIKVWDLKTGKLDPNTETPCREMRTYDWTTSFSGDLKVSIKPAGNSEVLVRNTSNQKTIRKIETEANSGASRVNIDGKKAVIRGNSGFRFYDVETGESRPVNNEFSVATAFDLSSDGRMFAQEGRPLETSIIVTDIESGDSWLLDGHPSSINAISYSPDNKTLAVAGNDRSIYFFNPNSRSLMKRFSGHSERVTAIAFSPDGKTLISGDGGSVIKSWEVSTGRVLSVANAGDRHDDVDKLEFDRNGRVFLALVNGSLSLWDASAMKPKVEIRTADGYESTSGRMTVSYSSVPITSATFCVNGKSVITSHTDGTIRLWDPETGNEANKFKVGEDVSFAVPTPDGKHVISVVDDGNKKNLQIIDIQNGEIIKRSGPFGITYLSKVSISRNGKYLAAVGNIGDTEIWDMEKLTLLRELDYELSGDDDVAFSSDSKTFFIGGENQNLSLYETESGKRLWQLIPAYQPGPLELKLRSERDARVAAITELKRKREKQAANDVEQFRRKVYLTFSHFGNMTDPGTRRLIENGSPEEGKARLTRETANAVWLRLHNDSPLPIKIPTQSFYLPNRECFHLFSDGQKMLGLCDDREIFIGHGVKDKNNEWLPYGFDFGSEAIILPNRSVTFPVPIDILRDEQSIVFSFSFQNIRASENDRSWDYGEKIELRFSEKSLPK